MRETKAQAVLEFIRSRSVLGGATFKEIQTFILRMNGIIGEHDERPFRHRGYWCDYLTQEGMYHGKHVGLLPRYCTKMPDGRWLLTEKIEGPFSVMEKPTRTYLHNTDRSRGAYERKVRSWPVCPGCGEHRNPRWMGLAPDGQACWKMQGTDASYDCKDRVWKTTVNYDRPGGEVQRMDPVLTDASKEEYTLVLRAASAAFDGEWEKQHAFVGSWLATRVK
jgi:hypothetical protein